MKNLWITEESKDFRYGYRVNKSLFSGQSDFQKVDVVETAGLGKMLFNDNLAMVSEKDEFVYHDMIAHVPLFTHPNPKKVLVIGGGDGGSLREALRHKSVEKCVMVEIDKMVVDACREHIPQTAIALDDQRAELIIDDGIKYAKETSEKFDVILVDSTDPIGPATPLFNVDFYKDLYRILNDDGIVVSQCENPYFELEMQKKLLSIKNEVFPKVFIYNYANLTYPGGFWSFSMASKGPNPIEDFDAQRVLDSGLEFQYYNQHLHSAAFALPSFQRKSYENLVQNP